MNRELGAPGSALRGFCVCLGVCSVLQQISPAAWAQELQPPPEQTEDVQARDLEALSEMDLGQLIAIKVVTATKSETTVEESPSIMTVFTRDDIRRLGAQKLADLLPWVPGFFEVGSQLLRNFAIRGVHSGTAQHFVILLDGTPTNDFLQSSAAAEMFSLEYVERVEILRGPGSAIYGAGALMGVINLITRSNHEVLELAGSVLAGTGPSGRVALTAGSGTEQHRTFLAFTGWVDYGTPYGVGGNEDVLYPRIGQNTFNGLQPGENLTQPRATTRVRVDRYGPSAELFIKQEFGEHLLVRLNAARNDRYLQRTYAQELVDASQELTPPRYVQQRLMLDVEARFGNRNTRGQFSIRPSLLFHTHDLSSPRISREFLDHPELALLGDRPEASVLYAWSGSDALTTLPLEYALKIGDVIGLRNVAIATGVQLEYRVAFGYSQTRCFAGQDPFGNFSPYGRDVHCHREAFFDEGLVANPEAGIFEDSDKKHLGNGDEWRVGNFLQLSANLPANIGIVLGARLDVHPKFGAQWSPRISLTSAVTENIYLKAQYARAFIFPAFLYYAGSNQLADTIGNPGIKPQSIDTIEALVGLRTRSVRAELNGFYNRVHDFITFDPSVNARTQQFLYTNQGDLTVMGSETSVTTTLLERYLTLIATGALSLPLAAHTDEQYIVNGKLGGPTKAPAYTLGCQLGSEPFDGLKLGLSFLHAGPVSSQQLRWTAFEDIEGTDGRIYSSRTQGDYPTRTYMLNANVKYRLNEHVEFRVLGTNLLNRRHYRPGALINPYLLPAIRIMAGASVFY